MNFDILLRARGWIAVSFGGMIFWAIGGFVHNDTIITAGIAGFIVGVLMSLVLILSRRF